MWKDWVVAWDDTLGGSLVYVCEAKGYMNVEKKACMLIKGEMKGISPLSLVRYDMTCKIFIIYLGIKIKNNIIIYKSDAKAKFLKD